MAPRVDLRIVADGDSAKIYHRGDEVTGTVVLALEEEEVDVNSLVLDFMGLVTTATTRPFYITGNDVDAAQSTRDYEERVALFNFKKELLPRCTVDRRKLSWTFDFKFPDTTTPKYSRFHHGPKYLKDPHTLPPSFRIRMDSPGATSMVSYFLKASLNIRGTKTPLKVYHVLPYHPTPENLDLTARVIPRVLYAQTWKPLSESQKTVEKALSKLSRRDTLTTNNPRIVPTLYLPERTAPGQHIPILFSLTNSNDSSDTDIDTRNLCTLDCVEISIGTHTTSICGHPASQPEDTMSKHVTCIDKKDINQPIPFGTQIKLTNNFRLVNDAECVPSFKTYTITRRYDLTAVVGIKYKNRPFTIRSTTSLEIAPRSPREPVHSVPEVEDGADDPLPLYTPREPSKELAPDYFSIYGGGVQGSSSNSSSASLAYSAGRSRGSSMTSGVSTPVSDVEEEGLDDCPVYTP